MGKRLRTPHYIPGIGDGHVSDSHNRPSDDLFLLNKKSNAAAFRARNERLVRMEEPGADHWKDVFASADPVHPTSVTTGPWQVSAFAILGMIVVLSAIFLHLVSESSSESSSPYHRRRYRQRRMYKTRKKKTDEWSDDEEDEILQQGAVMAAAVAPVPPEGPAAPALSVDTSKYPLFYNHLPPPRFAEHRHRRGGKDPATPPPLHSNSGNNRHYPNYKSPSAAANLSNRSPFHRGIGASNSFNSQSSNPSPGHGYANMNMNAPTSGRMRLATPPDGHDLLFPQPTGTSSSNSSGKLRLPTAPEESQLVLQPTLLPPPAGMVARPLNSSNFSSFASMEDTTPPPYRRSNPPSSEKSLNLGQLSHDSSHHGSQYASYQGSFSHSKRQQEDTPRVGNQRRVLTVEGSGALFPNMGNSMHDPTHPDAGLLPPGNPEYDMPFIPTLASHRSLESPHLVHLPPPRSVLMDELKLVQMETGNSMHWEVQQNYHDGIAPGIASPPISSSFASESSSGSYDDDDDDDMSIPSGDPRKLIIHKRADLTTSTDSATSLQSSIQFEELRLQEVIGGGGFGQVWRATWRGTPVAVKVLTGSAQGKHIAKAILEEFNAEINLLKGMRHPNICLYMGACVDPPNRAIITELAANGSVWDALRLPLMPPFVPADGTARGAWPLKLYVPSEHGAPPTFDMGMPRLTAPIPPKGTWSWELVKRVACGAARGMAYLHSGNPPVLHRDLKSANLLLDESYTTKVCDFGLSRLKAQERSMTGNCGTVQWMAPEVLANMSYNEKADVYSFGIIVWELLTRECPYEGMTAIQCALAVLNRDKRPEIPKWCPPSLHALIKACVKKEPDLRPTFEQILLALDAMD